jgi:import inner membrane translocase subunit TIM10
MLPLTSYRHLDPRLNKCEDHPGWWARMLTPYLNQPVPSRNRADRMLTTLSYSALCPYASKLRSDQGDSYCFCCVEKMMATSQQQVQMSLMEMKGLADSYHRMSVSCYRKCIPNVKEAALAVGEMSCIDRCVSKYLDVHAIVGSTLSQYTQ